MYLYHKRLAAESPGLRRYEIRKWPPAPFWTRRFYDDPTQARCHWKAQTLGLQEIQIPVFYVNLIAHNRRPKLTRSLMQKCIAHTNPVISTIVVRVEVHVSKGTKRDEQVDVRV